jgi:type VI secretion system VasI family protein
MPYTRKLPPLLALVLLGGAAVAQTQPADPVQKRLAECASVSSMLDRLRCYDQLAKDSRDVREGRPVTAAPQPAPEAKPGDPGRWRRDERRSNDGRVIAIRIETEGDHDPAAGGQRAKPVLNLSCSEDGMQMWTAAPAARPNQQTLVTLQAGRTNALTQRWTNTADGRFVGAWKDGEDAAKRLLAQPRLRIAFGTGERMPADNSPAYRFDLQGYDAAVAPLRQLCGW